MSLAIRRLFQQIASAFHIGKFRQAMVLNKCAVRHLCRACRNVQGFLTAFAHSVNCPLPKRRGWNLTHSQEMGKVIE
jgi:hypothetical protein